MPGTNLCDEGWTTEYVGYVSSQRTVEGRQRSEFICVDEDPEVTSHSSPDNDFGAVLYVVQTVCGSLPCIPYAADRDLLCVVCSR